MEVQCQLLQEEGQAVEVASEGCEVAASGKEAAFAGEDNGAYVGRLIAFEKGFGEFPEEPYRSAWRLWRRLGGRAPWRRHSH